jgi:hypothetical protein
MKYIDTSHNFITRFLTLFVVLDPSYCSTFAAFFVCSILLNCSHFIYSATFCSCPFPTASNFALLPFILYCTVVQLL